MWIKIFLFATPATFLALLCFSVVFVPSTIEVARSDYRIDRLVFSHNGDVNSMNPYLSTTTTDSDVYTHIFESLIDLDEYYRYKYKTARSMRVCEDVVVLLDPDQDPATLRNTLEVALGNDLPDIFDGFRAYDHEEFQSGSPLMYINDGLSAGAAEALAPNYLVFRLRPAPARRLGENEIPTAVDAQIISRIESALEQAGGRSGFAKQYDARHCAARWYMHHNGIADMELPAPLSQEVSKDPATVKAFEEQWTGISKALSTEANARYPGVMAFDAYLATFPQQRIGEYPVVDIHMREGIKWHDYGQKLETLDDKGRPIDIVVKEFLDARDVAFTFQFVGDPIVRSPRSSLTELVLQMRLDPSDPLHFEIVYREPYSPAVSDLTYSILPEHRFSDKVWTREAMRKGKGPVVYGDQSYNPREALPADRLDFAMMPVGTGPFKMARLNGDSLPPWRAGELITLERNEDYWDPVEMPQYRYMDFMIFDAQLGQETSTIAFSSGSTDVKTVTVSELDQFARQQDDLYMYSRLALTYEYLAFNMESEFFNDKRVRQALTLAVDVDAILKYVYGGRGVRISGPVYPILDYYHWDYVPDYTYRQGKHAGKTFKEVGLKYYPYDLDEAKALLDEAGWKMGSDGIRQKNGKKFEFALLDGTGETSPRGKIATLAIENWRRLGLNVKFESKNFQIFVKEHALARKFDMLVLGWQGGGDYDMRQLWHSSFLSPRGMNFCAYQSAEADKLMEDILREYDNDKIVPMSHRIFDLIADDCPYIFLVSPLGTAAVDRHFYWNKPQLDGNGNVIGRTPHSLVDPVAMVSKVGPRNFLYQWKRSPDIEFPHDPARDVERVNSDEARALYRKVYGVDAPR